MSTDFENRLRTARDSLPKPDSTVTAAAEQRLLASLTAAIREPRPLRLRHRWNRVATVRAAYAAALVGVAAAFFFVGAFVYTTSGSGSVGVDSPGFLPASGWNEVTTGTVPMDQGPTATAANVPIVPEGGYVGTFPTHTLAKLPASGIVFQAVIGNRADATPDYTPMQLPLQLSDARVSPGWEGQPNSDVPMYQITAIVGNYILEVDAFFGTQHPSAAQLASAQDELNRLEVPSS